MIRALIFDFHGLILDTETPEFQAWQEVYEQHGCSLPLAAWATGIGTQSDTFNPYRYLEDQLGRAIDRGLIREQRTRRKDALIAAELVLPGVEAYIAAAVRLGLKLGVASSSSREWVTGHLARLDLLDQIGCVRCADDVEKVKPEPELYQAVLRGLDVRADEAIAFEDSPNGVLAARRAGIFCVAVPNALTETLPLDHADLRLASLAEMRLDALLAQVEQGQIAGRGYN